MFNKIVRSVKKLFLNRLFNKSVIQEIKTFKKNLVWKNRSFQIFWKICPFIVFFQLSVLVFCCSFFKKNYGFSFLWTIQFLFFLERHLLLTKILGLNPYILNRPIRFSPPNIQILMNYGNANQTFLLAITIGSVAAALVFLAMLFLDDHHSIDDPCCTFIGNLL